MAEREQMDNKQQQQQGKEVNDEENKQQQQDKDEEELDISNRRHRCSECEWLESRGQGGQEEQQEDDQQQKDAGIVVLVQQKQNQVPEGMDPLTGNYIRPTARRGADDVNGKGKKEAIRRKGQGDDRSGSTKGGPNEEASNRKSAEERESDRMTGGKQPAEQHQQQVHQHHHFGHNIALSSAATLAVPQGHKGSERKKSTSGSESGGSGRGGWSWRLVSTLSNKSREPIEQRSEDEEEEEGGADWAGNCLFGGQIRFTIMALSTLCLSAILSNILTFNFTYICMAGERPDNFSAIMAKDKLLGDWEEVEWKELGYNPDLDYSSAQRSALFMAVAVGALLAVFPLTLLLNRYGSRLVFGLLGYVSSAATVLLPLAALSGGFPAMLLVRVVQGAAFSACLPVMGSITSHWSTLKQNGIFIAILSSFLQIAPIFTMPVSGALCTSQLGWQFVYYLHALVTFLLFTVFLLYHRNSPIKHPMVSRNELVKVMFNKGGSIYSGPNNNNGNGQKKRKKSKKVPYRAMYADMHIWAILVASFGNFMGTQLSLQFMPTYINKVLHFEVEKTGTASAISPLIMFFIKLVAGQSSDRIKFLSDGVKLRVYNTLSMGAMGALFILLAFLDPHSQPGLCLVVLIASTCILGFNSGGFFKSSQQVSRQHSHFTLANISFVNCVCMLLTPLLNELLAPDNTPPQWTLVLCIHGITLTLTNVFFCVFGSAKPAKWALMDNASNNNKRPPTWRRQKVAPVEGGGGAEQVQQEQKKKKKNGSTTTGNKADVVVVVVPNDEDEEER